MQPIPIPVSIQNVMQFGRDCERRYVGPTYTGSQNDNAADAVRHATASALSGYLWGSLATSMLGEANEWAEANNIKSEAPLPKGTTRAQREAMDRSNNAIGAAIGAALKHHQLTPLEARERIYDHVIKAMHAGLLVTDLSPSSIEKTTLLREAGTARLIESMGLEAYIQQVDKNRDRVCTAQEIRAYQSSPPPFMDITRLR